MKLQADLKWCWYQVVSLAFWEETNNGTLPLETQKNKTQQLIKCTEPVGLSKDGKQRNIVAVQVQASTTKEK